MSKRYRPRGSGSIRNRGTKKDPRWFAYYSVPVDGQRRQISEGPFRLKGEAEEWLQDSIKRARDGRGLLPGKVQMADLFDQWLASTEKRIVRSTHSEYSRHVRLRLNPHLGHLAVGDLRPDHIVKMLNELRRPGANKRSKSPRPLAETTLQHTLTSLRTALNWAVRQRLVAYNQALDVDMPQREDLNLVVWTSTELSAFMRWASKKRFYPLLRLAAFTGMRRSELLALRWRDVDLDRSLLRVRRVRYKDGYQMIEEERTKSKRGKRVVDLDSSTIEVLRAWKTDQDRERREWGSAYEESGIVFTAENGAAFHADRVAQAFNRFVLSAPVPVIRFHDMRHTHASLLLAEGIPVVDVAYRLGDTPETILSTYAHFIPGQGQRTASAFSILVDGEKSG